MKWRVFWNVALCSHVDVDDVLEVRTASIIRTMNEDAFIALMTVAVLTSETSVNFNLTTRRYVPEDSKLHTRRRENLKSQMEY
jgi:hypothetical protein